MPPANDGSLIPSINQQTFETPLTNLKFRLFNNALNEWTQGFNNVNFATEHRQYVLLFFV